MKHFIVCAAFCLALTAALPYTVVEDDYGEEYYLVPLSRRARRDVIDWKVEDPSKVNIQHTKTFTIDENKKLDVTSYARKDLLDKRAPPTLGGKFEFKNDDKFGAVFRAENTKHRGTDVGLDAKYSVYKQGPLSVDLTGGYSRHFGGLGGTQHHDKNVFLSGHIDY